MTKTKKATRKTKKQQLEQLKDAAQAAYLNHPESDAIEEAVDEVVSDYGYRVRDAIERLEGELVDEINSLGEKYGRGLIRIALANAGLPDFDNPVFDPSEFMKHERDWQDEAGDYEEAAITECSFNKEDLAIADAETAAVLGDPKPAVNHDAWEKMKAQAFKSNTN